MRTFNKFIWAAALLALPVLASCTKEKKVPDPKILSFGFTKANNPSLSADATVTISGTTIDVVLPYDAGINEPLIPVFTANEGNTVHAGGVEVISGSTSLGVASPLTLLVTSSDGSKSLSYKVNVKVAPDSNPTLLSFSFAAQDNPVSLSKDFEGTVSGSDISVEMPKTSDKSHLVATFTTIPGNVVKIGNTVQESGVTANDFTNPVDYTITNSDGSRNTLCTVTIKNVNGTWKAVSTYSEIPVYSGAVLKINPSDNMPYVAFKERTDVADNEKMNVVKFDGSAWSLVGDRQFSDVVSASAYDFDIADDGSMFVAYASKASAGTSPQVLEWEGSSWAKVGGDYANDTKPSYLSIAAVADRNVMMTMVNDKAGTFARRTYVSSFWDGTAWKNINPAPLGTNAFYKGKTCQGGGAIYTLAIHRGAYDGVSYGLEVLKYENGAWTSVRDNHVTEGATQNGIHVLSATVADDGTLYTLVPENSATDYHFLVEKYDPATKAWSTVGGSCIGYIHGDSHDKAAVAAAPDGTPYVVYYDYKNTRLYVTYVDSDSKTWSDPVEIAAEAVSDPCLEFDFSGVGYISYIANDNSLKLLELR